MTFDDYGFSGKRTHPVLLFIAGVTYQMGAFDLILAGHWILGTVVALLTIALILREATR